jgi:hypothetical protein
MAARNIPVTWHVPEDMIAEYATHVVVQSAEKEIFLSFFQAQPPIIVGDESERQKQLDSIASISTRCIAKVIVAPSKLPEIIQMLQDVVRRQQESSQEDHE